MNSKAFLSLVLALPLAGLAGLHLYWACGGSWPGKDRADLTAKVLGGPAKQAFPGPLACLLVFLGLGAGLLVALQLGFILNGFHPEVARPLGMAFAAVFFIRGLAGFGMHRLAFWRRSDEFNRRNRYFYSPLCLLIAMLYAGLLL